MLWLNPQKAITRRLMLNPASKKSGVEITTEQSLVRAYSDQRHIAVTTLLRSSVYCSAIAALFLYLALERNEPRYAIGIFVMFLCYLAIRVYSARRVAGVMPRIIQRYETRIRELEDKLDKIPSRTA